MRRWLFKAFLHSWLMHSYRHYNEKKEKMTIKKREQSTAWWEAVLSWLKPQSIALFFLGFAAGLPYFLIFSTLSLWLREAGIERGAVTFFSWAALGYSFKFFWSPLVDMLPLPILTKILGRRRGWLFFAQMMIIASIALMAAMNPAAGSTALFSMALAAVLLGFSAATQDIVIDAYRIECAPEEMQALLSSMYIAGYRVGMLVSGAGALAFAAYLGTSAENYDYFAWQKTYLLMAAAMGIGLLTTLCIKEPERAEERGASSYPYSTKEYGKQVLLFLVCAALFALSFFYGGLFLKALFGKFSGITAFLLEMFRFLFSLAAAGTIAYGTVKKGLVNKEMVEKSYIEPIVDFFLRYGRNTALLLLLLIGFYRLSDIVLGVTANIFYLDMGFTKDNIAAISKTFGLAMTLTGGFLGGILSVRFGVYRILMAGAVLSSLTNLLFMILAGSEPNRHLLTLVIAADNLAGGIAVAAFTAFLSSLTNISFTAVQYAVFSSIMTLFPKLIGGYSGTMVKAFGYDTFFLLTAVMGIPVVVLVWLAGRLMEKEG